MSIETTRARAEAMAAGVAWYTHRRDCAACVRAQRSRRPDQMCTAGQPLYTAHETAESQLDRQRQLDQEPLPGQEALF